MKRVHLIISGDVVGVGFRSFVLHAAKRLGIAGWVKNREDKAVEVMAEGEEEAVEKLVALCSKGPDVAWVEHMVVTRRKATGEFVTFSVVY